MVGALESRLRQPQALRPVLCPAPNVPCLVVMFSPALAAKSRSFGQQDDRNRRQRRKAPPTCPELSAASKSSSTRWAPRLTFTTSAPRGNHPKSSALSSPLQRGRAGWGRVGVHFG